ncbi:CHAT domain-containing protein [Streptomyces liangshanensis]|uniref:CHAT domain-containing protein n=1 Tax=Streptomyces liangshanensis TaxID=2717324 RepID=A0A6G9GTH9_9ACTN|nr:CHAT domain-containing protein [Streptomyces liangshanensis]QIQ01247.1 CHAT domain-containing protein [Streptomyces liangshanensis]
MRRSASPQEAEFDRIQQAVEAIRVRGRRDGPAAVADDVWRLMRHCVDLMVQGDPAFARLVFRTARISFGVHAELGQWFFASVSSLLFTGAVAVIDAQNTKNGVDFPEDALPDIQVMADLSVDVAHRAGVPLAGYLVAEGLTGRQMGDRTIARELSEFLGGEDAVRRLRGLRRSVRAAAGRMADLPDAVDTVVALRAQADLMMVQELDRTIEELASGDGLHSGARTVSGVLAADRTARSVLYLAPGVEGGTVIRLEGPESGRRLCESIALPGLGLREVQACLDTLRGSLASEPPLVKARDRAVRTAHAAVTDAVWKPVLDAWPDLLGGRVALVPLGQSALLPLYTAPVDGIPVCGLLDLTVVPSGNALMFAAAWPRPSRVDPLVVADPWYHDGAGGRPIPCTVPEARRVAAVHGVAPTILREQNTAAADPGGPERVRGLGRSSGGVTRRPGLAPVDLARRMTSANLIHLAGHGSLDAHRPLESTILLGGPLPLSSLLGHDLRRGTTVVLSACHLAGIGVRLPGEQLGFPAALLAMGASSVIAALWAVPDSEQTIELMASLHEELHRGVLPSAALGHAVTRAAAEGARPTAWGSFTHFGA